MSVRSRRGLGLAVAVIVMSSALAGGGAAVASAPAATGATTSSGPLHGTVTADGSPVRGARVTLSVAGSSPGTAHSVAVVHTDARGRFTSAVPSSVRPDAVLYATATGGTAGAHRLGPAVELAASLGDIRSGTVVVDELATVAAGAALAQFAVRGSLGGTAPGITNAARMTRNLVDPRTGRVAAFLRSAPNGSDTDALATFDSLASIIAGCVAGTNDCARFLDAASDEWGARPATTWQAMTFLPTNPSGAPARILAQVPRHPRFTPVRTTPPAGWYLVLKFWGDGRQFNGPGNLAFDSQGRVWANTNATWAPTLKGVCPGTSIFRLNPYAAGRPVAEYSGGGLNGSGFGFALDAEDNAWATNYGFTGPLCPVAPTSNSASEFSSTGAALSPDSGYENGPLSWPQGVKADAFGNVWIANCGDDNLVEYPGGNAARARTLDAPGLGKTFDVAQNTAGDIFVTSNSTDQVFEFDQSGRHVATLGSGATTLKPLGLASDSRGNVWVSASGVVDIPCTSGLTAENGPALGSAAESEDGAMVQIAPDGTATRFSGAGMTVPWGIAVDGDDSIWVANFFGQRLSHLCGADLATCPSHRAGAPISPARTGYFSDALQRNTGVQIDASGNVWLTNNWKTVPSAKTGPYGDGLVVFLGMAKPISMPLVGTPEATEPVR